MLESECRYANVKIVVNAKGDSAAIDVSSAANRVFDYTAATLAFGRQLGNWGDVALGVMRTRGVT